MKVEAGRAGAACAFAALIGIMAASASLSGCAVAMLNGAAQSGSSSSSTSTSAPARSSSQLAADNAISTAVRSRFSASPALKTLKLTVDTHDGIVTLRGQVNNVDQRNAAQLEARAVKGVKAVKNELTVR